MTFLINAQNISKSFGSEALFSNISIAILQQERIGLIGPNGSGKSTLLKILMGMETADEGKLVCNNNAHLVYLAQEDDFNPNATLKEILFGQQANQLADSACHHQIWQCAGENLFPDLAQTVVNLSGGWRKRLAIVQAIMKNPDLLCMDEPTNHLDLEGILWLENLLKKARFAFLVVSHDRYFLNQVVNTVVELNAVFPQGYFKITGNYQQFMQKRADFIAGQFKTAQTLSNKLRQQAEWLQRMPKARTTKAQYRIEQAEQLKVDLQKINARNTQNKTAAIDFTATQRKTKTLLEVKNLKFSRSGKLLLEKLDLKLSPGLCIGLLGRNGSGKSTLLHLLNGDLMPDSGSIERALHLKTVLFDQKRAQLNRNQSLLRALAPAGDSVVYQGTSIHVVAWAKRFLFSAEQLSQSVATLSGGEQARVLIANLMLQPADILLLDEPTNDLDIQTLEILEESLQEFPGAIVLISHDRFLLDRVSDKLLYLDGHGEATFFADYQQWQQTLSAAKATPQTTAVTTADKIKKTKLLNYDEQRELACLPTRIQKAEEEIALLEVQLQNPDIGTQLDKLLAIQQKIETLQSKIATLYQQWEELEKKGMESK